jgi:hypothetical protein
MGNIPSITYTIRHSLDRLQRQHRYYEQEILKSRQLTFGLPGTITSPSHGIVSQTDPAGHTAGSTNPLVVSPNATITSTVDVNLGTLVFNSGVWLELHGVVRQISLADPAVGTPNVVYLQYRLENANLSLNDGLQPVVPHTMRIADTIDITTLPESVLIGVATVTNYLALPSSTLADVVPLAVVTTQVSGGVTSLSIDHTRASYTWNRPWYSAQDLQHRGQTGTGAVTQGNPHGTTAGDLTAGDFTMLQLLLDHGLVVADDKNAVKVPGYRCEATIGTFYDDDGLGTITGYPGAPYCALPFYPVAVGLCYIESSGVAWSGLQVPGTNLVVCPYDGVPPGESLHIFYNRVEACEPPVVGTTTFRTNNPASEELVVAGGAALTSLANVEETMGDAYQFPQRYDFFVDGTGALLKTPQVVYCWKRLDDLGASDVPTITPYGPGRLLVGLMGAPPLPAVWAIQLRIYGTDATGATIDELFTLSSAMWVSPGAPGTTTYTPGAFSWSLADFASITNIVVVSRVGDGPNSGIMVWSQQTPQSNYSKMKDCCHVASAHWSGYSFTSMWDRRVISTTVKPEVTALDTLQDQFLLTLIAGGSATVWCEDLRRPRYSMLADATIAGDAAVALHPTRLLSKWQIGAAGAYMSAALPVVSTSGTIWRCTLLRHRHRDTLWFNGTPVFYAYAGGAWNSYTMVPVAGLPDTYEIDIAPLTTPSHVRISLANVQANGYILYG